MLRRTPPESSFAQAADCLAPAEELLDALAHNLARPIGARLEHTAAQSDGVSSIAGHMSRGALLDQCHDEAMSVITLVGADALGSKMLAPLAPEHGKHRLRFGDTHRGGQHHIGHQSMAVIHQGVTGEAQLRLFAQAFAQQLRFRACGARMGIVRASLAFEIPIPTGIRARSATILALIRFHRRDAKQNCQSRRLVAKQ
jgi:hypothetical protein